ncbi:aminotransferase class III-fold pyridoxal phosphate-dependent enzyme [Phototrophicus methaneseepsis]|uniref:(S)-3-amino-2-methylpropionate transaminase n=1 Tax=Phototrophicus methaneseepsis TaxID=2710758 RepID=A0A7S8E6G0_9CHLR|nr:aminotransferase class III-fold pyridoxal phosphate-dependent enzyme [Phototrophicus methaneseepsis]QPC81173.1 aminotransferase class III-fold pyridoxal phosphate-dependent enzyme [Phototrophicus methaneseepsis]
MVSHQNGFVLREPGEKSRDVIQRDIKTLSPSYTRSYGFAVDHGQGAEVWDVDGNRYIDFAAGIAVLSTGYSHPRVVKAITDQAQKYLHIGGTDFFCPKPVELAERLQQIVPIHHTAPEDKLVYFANSGTESIEAALKLARYQEGRSHVIAFYGGFHGRTMGSLSLTASKYKQREGYPYIPGGVTHIPYPSRAECDDCGEGSDCSDQSWCDAVAFIEKFVLKMVSPSEIAAVVVEPIQGEGGYLVPRDDFFPKLREFCDKHGILLVVDEIQSGVGRSGKFTALEHWGVAADIVCLAKGLGSGMPIGAVVASNKVMGQWVPGAHASTFGGNPVSCAAALATLDVFEEEGLLAHVTELGDYTLDRLTRFKADHPILKRIDGKGFMIGLDFVDANGEPAPKLRDAVVNQCYLDGLLTLGCGANGIRFAPPLVLTRELLDEGLMILERAIAHIEEEMWETT